MSSVSRKGHSLESRNLFRELTIFSMFVEEKEEGG